MKQTLEIMEAKFSCKSIKDGGVKRSSGNLSEGCNIKHGKSMHEDAHHSTVYNSKGEYQLSPTIRDQLITVGISLSIEDGGFKDCENMKGCFFYNTGYQKKS